MGTCDEVSASDLRAIAIAAAGPPPRVHEQVEAHCAKAYIGRRVSGHTVAVVCEMPTQRSVAL
jgi:hypothetical protein